MTTTLEETCRELLSELGLISADGQIEVRPLTGGVASDIALVEAGSKRFCVKLALPKLKVAADWHAPVHRNAAEYAWLKDAARIVPEGAVRLFGRSERLHGFAMEFLEGDDVYLWKDALLQGRAPEGEAAKVGDALGRIHKASSQPDFPTDAYQNRDDFWALRIEPYITYTAGQHPDLAEPLTELAEMLYEGNAVLVHGDVSPKNILLRDKRPILLDAECATMGDPSFDLSFCLNHIILKALHVPGCFDTYLAEVSAFWGAYEPHVTWEGAGQLEARVARLVPALMLARVDGKSPVEYLSSNEQAVVRKLAIQFIEHPVDRLDALVAGIAETKKGRNA